MTIWALVNESNIVINVSFSYVEGWIENEEEVFIGDVYDPLTGTFTSPTPPPYVEPKLVEMITEDYTTVPYNDTILADATAGDIEVVLVGPLSKKITVSKIDESINTVTIIGTINGQENFIIDRPKAAYTLAYADDQFFITGVV